MTLTRHEVESEQDLHPWAVTTRFNGSAVAGVSIAGDELVVLVSDGDLAHSGTMARLARDGSATVACLQAPQALVVHHGRPQLVPHLPGLSDEVEIDSSDVLVLCSAGVLEHLPRGFGLVMDRISSSDEGLDVNRLLGEILSYAKNGAAAVVSRRPLSVA